MSLRELERACLRSPETPVRKELAARYLQSGRLEECIAIATDILRSSPQDSSLQMMIATAQIEAGELEAASRSRAVLREMSVSRTDLLRLSLALRRARSKQNAPATPSSVGDQVGRLPCPSVLDSMEFEIFVECSGSGVFETPRDSCEVDLDALEEVFDLEGSAEQSLEESTAEPDASEALPEYYVGPTREVKLSGDDRDADALSTYSLQTSDLRRSLSEFFSS